MSITYNMSSSDREEESVGWLTEEDIEDQDMKQDILVVRETSFGDLDVIFDCAEIFVNVMSYVELSDALTCTHVCKKWYFRDDYIWRQVFFATFVRDPIHEVISLMYQRKCESDKICNNQSTWLSRIPWEVSSRRIYEYLKRDGIPKHANFRCSI
jgi:hypothetical protein